MHGFVALGSNVGDRRAHLLEGLDGLERAAVRPVALSSVWETEPVGPSGPGWFLNMVAEIRSDRKPLELLEVLLDVERRAGRVRTTPGGARTLDLDLLLYGGLAHDGPRLQLPHPRMWERGFVLEPLCELAPEVRNPATGRTVADERRRLRIGSAVRRVGKLATARSQPL